MRFVHVQVVDTHTSEIDGIIPPIFHDKHQIFQFGLQIGLTFQAAFHQGDGSLFSLCLQHFEVLFHAVQFILQYLLLDFRRLRYHAELLMRKDYGIPIVILNLPEDLLALFGCKIRLARVKNFCRRISGTERFGNLVYVGFQPDNHRFMNQTESFFLISGTTHDKCFSAADLVVDNPASEQFVHPNRIFLTRVQILNT